MSLSRLMSALSQSYSVLVIVTVFAWFCISGFGTKFSLVSLLVLKRGPGRRVPGPTSTAAGWIVSPARTPEHVKRRLLTASSSAAAVAVDGGDLVTRSWACRAVDDDLNADDVVQRQEAVIWRIRGWVARKSLRKGFRCRTRHHLLATRWRKNIRFQSYYFILVWGVVIMSATIWSIVLVPDDGWWWVWGNQWNNWQGKRNTQRQPAPVPFSPP